MSYSHEKEISLKDWSAQKKKPRKQDEEYKELRRIIQEGKEMEQRLNSFANFDGGNHTNSEYMPLKASKSKYCIMTGYNICYLSSFIEQRKSKRSQSAQGFRRDKENEISNHKASTIQVNKSPQKVTFEEW